MDPIFGSTYFKKESCGRTHRPPSADIAEGGPRESASLSRRAQRRAGDESKPISCCYKPKPLCVQIPPRRPLTPRTLHAPPLFRKMDIGTKQNHEIFHNAYYHTHKLPRATRSEQKKKMLNTLFTLTKCSNKCYLLEIYISTLTGNF